MKKSIQPTPPEDKEKNTKITAPADYAGGIPSVQTSFKHVLAEMNLNSSWNTLFNLNQKQGIDCPGCAWPDPDGPRSKVAEYCENGVKAIAEEATKKRIGPEFFRKYSVAELSQWSDYEIGKSGRLTHPMIKREGSTHYEPIDWEGAFQLIAEQLNALASPDEAIFYTSGRTSNEAAFLYQLFVRQFGTNNLPDCSNMCHESSGVGLAETLGIGKGSVKLEDFLVTDLIIIMGQNPGTNHPRMLATLQQAKKAGAKIITVNPIPEAGLQRFKHPQKLADWFGRGTELTDLYLQVRINEDIALLKALMLQLLSAEKEQPDTVFDNDFIQKRTAGFQDFLRDLQQHSPEALAQQCGVPLSEIQQAAALVTKAQKIIVCWAMGLTQHQNGVQNIREIVNLLLLKGSVGKPGGGTCPVRGHSNVQGDRTMGIWESPKPAFLDKLQEVFDFEPPRRHGYHTVSAIKAMYEKKAKVFFALGGNFLSATPDTEYTARALQTCNLTVQVSTKLNRSHLVTGRMALILPCLGRTEEDHQADGLQFVSVENSMGGVHQSRGKIAPASGHLLSEPAIIARLAKATLGYSSKTDWLWYIENYDRIRNAIEQTIPGFDNYNERVRRPGGFYLPNGARQGEFNTTDRKAQFSVNSLPKHQLQPGEFLMMTIRSHDQFNTTIYGLDDRYRGIFNGRRIVLMNPQDVEKLGLVTGDFVDLSSHFEGETRLAPNFMVVSYPIPAQNLATYFPEANVLVPVNHYADKSFTPASKSVVVKVRASSD